MTPDQVKADYRAALCRTGETVVIKRYSGTGAERVSVTVSVKARILAYKPAELVGTIKQGDQRVIALAEDFCGGAVDLPLRTGDKVVVRGRELNIEAVDDNTRRIAGALIAYDLQVRG